MIAAGHYNNNTSLPIKEQEQDCPCVIIDLRDKMGKKR
jgi:hypothetical protein